MEDYGIIGIIPPYNGGDRTPEAPKTIQSVFGGRKTRPKSQQWEYSGQPLGRSRPAMLDPDEIELKPENIELNETIGKKDPALHRIRLKNAELRRAIAKSEASKHKLASEIEKFKAEVDQYHRQSEIDSKFLQKQDAEVERSSKSLQLYKQIVAKKDKELQRSSLAFNNAEQEKEQYEKILRKIICDPKAAEFVQSFLGSKN